MAIDNKVEKAYFDLTFHREETGQKEYGFAHAGDSIATFTPFCGHLQA